MAEIFLISDTHINHYNVVLHCNREQFIYDNPNFDPSKPVHFKFNNPKAVHLQMHDDFQVDNWNSKATKKDTIWVLGDFAWKNHAHYIQRLNGKKFLIRGNHDKMTQDAFELFNKIEGCHYQYSYFTKINGQQVMLSHCPYDTWFSSCHGSWNLYGHCHGRREEKPRTLSCDVGYDVWGGLIPWDILAAKMNDKAKIRKEYFAQKDLEPQSEGADRFVSINKEINLRYMNGEKNVLS